MLAPASTKTMKNTNLIAFGAIGTAAIIAFSGCSSSAPSGNGDDGDGDGGSANAKKPTVYDFPLNGMAPVKDGEEISVVLPDDLREAAGESIDEVLVESFTISSHKLDTAERCALDITVKLPAGDARDNIISHYDDSEIHADDTDGQKLANALLFRGDIERLDDLDKASPEPEVYADDKGESFVVVTECAVSPTDPDADTQLYFPFPESSDEFDDFASVKAAVMTDGTVSITSNSVEDWMLDSNGNWIAD